MTDKGDLGSWLDETTKEPALDQKADYTKLPRDDGGKWQPAITDVFGNPITKED